MKQKHIPQAHKLNAQLQALQKAHMDLASYRDPLVAVTVNHLQTCAIGVQAIRNAICDEIGTVKYQMIKLGIGEIEG